ncbi:MAG: sugar transferase [Actinobacteria bacterium]|nr:sugar transferase [Actinomycetota bacterium]
MTEPLQHSSLSESLDEALRLGARAAALPHAVEQESADEQLATASRLGRILQAGTVAADAVALAAALAYLDLTRDPRAAAAVVPALTLGWLVLLEAWGGYRRGLGYALADEAKSAFLAAFSGSLLILQLGPAIGLETSRSGLEAIAAPIALLAVSRAALRFVGGALRRRRALVRRVLLVGDGADAEELLENLEAWPGLAIEVVGICADSDRVSVRGFPVLGPTRSCNLVAGDLGLRTVILAPASLAPAECSHIHGELLAAEREVILAPNVSQVQAGRLSARQLGGLSVLRLVRRYSLLRRATKRAFDLAGATLLLVFLTPFLVAVAALIRLDSRGPAFFRQVRVGRNGALFELWKFRTMRADAEAMLLELEQENESDGLFKVRDDPRVTRVGRWLRRTSLDELPQLWNVFLGEMSLVGPRPALPQEISRFDDFTLRRLRVRPGMTGLWQVSGRSDASFATYSRMDAFYAENWTIVGDLQILLRTIPVVFGSKGAY